jgi:hypothetical protein
MPYRIFISLKNINKISKIIYIENNDYNNYNINELYNVVYKHITSHMDYNNIDIQNYQRFLTKCYFTYNGKILVPNTQISKYNIVGDSTIYLNIRP